MANFLRKVHNSPKLRALKAKRNKLVAAQKLLARKYKVTFKKEARRMAKKGPAHKGHARKGHRR